MSALFANLPLDAAVRTLRFLSAHPRKRTWRAFIDITDILTLCHLCPGLENIVHFIFDTLCTRNVDEDTKCEGFRGRTLCVPELLRCLVEAQLGNLEFLKRFKNLQINLADVNVKSENNLLCNTSQFKYLTATCTLSIDGVQGNTTLTHEILNRIGHRLTALHIHDTIRNAPDMMNTCPRLHELSVNLGSSVDEKFWYALRNTLQRLSLNVSALEHTYACSVLHSVGQHCRKITNLQITYPGYALCETVTTVASSYGCQLYNLRVSWLKAYHTMTIAKCCPYVLMDIGLCSKAIEEIFASTTRNFLIGSTINGSINKYAMRYWPTLRIQRLELRVEDGNFPYAALQYLLDCDIHYNGHSPTEFIYSLAQATGSLRNLKLRIGYPEPGAFSQLIRFNPNIRSVQLTCCRQYSYDFEVGQLVVNKPNNILPTLSDLASAIFTAPNIEAFEFGKLDVKERLEFSYCAEPSKHRLENIFNKLRHKLIDVVIHFEEYLT